MALLAEQTEGSRVLTSPELWPGVPNSLSFPQWRVMLGILMGGNKNFGGNGSPGGKHVGQALSKVWHPKRGSVRRRGEARGRWPEGETAPHGNSAALTNPLPAGMFKFKILLTHPHGTRGEKQRPTCTEVRQTKTFWLRDFWISRGASMPRVGFMADAV